LWTNSRYSYYYCHSPIEAAGGARNGHKTMPKRSLCWPATDNFFWFVVPRAWSAPRCIR
jgi:hypothetical protein